MVRGFLGRFNGRTVVREWSLAIDQAHRAAYHHRVGWVGGFDMELRRHAWCFLVRAAWPALGAIGCHSAESQCERLAEPACPECAPGSLRWRQMYLGGARTSVDGLVVDACGSAVVVGSMAVDSNGADERAFVAKYGPDGDLAWIDLSGHEFGDRWLAIATDGDAIVVGGRQQRDPPRYATSRTDAVLARYSADGEVLWVREIVSGENVSVTDVIVTEGDARIVAAADGSLRMFDIDGHELGPAITSPEPIRALAATDDGGFIAAVDDTITRYDAEGVAGPSQPAPRVQAIAVGDDGRILAIDGSAGTRLLELPAPAPRPASRQPSDDRITLNAVAIDDHGRSVLGGHMRRDGVRGPWAQQRGRDGSIAWTWSSPTTDRDQLSAMALAPDGTVVLAGTSPAPTGDKDIDLWIGAIAP